MSAEECCVVKHFEENNQCAADGHFIIPLLMNFEVGVLGESRSEAVRSFLSLLHLRGQIDELSAVICEYFTLGHAEEVPQSAVNFLPVIFLPVNFLPVNFLPVICSELSTLTVVLHSFCTLCKRNAALRLKYVQCLMLPHRHLPEYC